LDPSAQRFQVLRDGVIVQAGKFQDLLQSGTDFSTLMCAHNEALEDMQKNANTRKNVDLNGKSIDVEKTENEAKNENENDKENGTHPKHLVKEIENVNGNSNASHVQQLVKEEEREKGQVSSKVYWAYATDVARGAFIPVYLFAQISFQALQILNSYWMAWGTSSVEGGSSSARVPTKTLILVYILLAVVGTICLLVRTITVSMVGLKTAQNYFLRMLRSIFQAPMSFFDSTPSGRILSRVSVSLVSLHLQKKEYDR